MAIFEFVITGLPFTFDPAQIAGLSVAATYDLSGYLDVNILQKYSDEIASATGRFRAAFNRG